MCYSIDFANCIPKRSIKTLGIKMTVCFPLVYILRRFRCPSRKRRCGKRPETFLTPYEMDLVPLMLKVRPFCFTTLNISMFRSFVKSIRAFSKLSRSDGLKKQLDQPVKQTAVNRPKASHCLRTVYTVSFESTLIIKV